MCTKRLTLFCSQKFAQLMCTFSFRRIGLKCSLRRLNARSLLCAFLSWKQEICNTKLAKNEQSYGISLSESQWINSELSAQISDLKRYRYSSLVKLSETRNRFVVLDDINHEISKFCGSFHSQKMSPEPMHALSNEGQLAALETALISLGTCLSPWIRPRLNLSLVDYVDSLREDLMMAFANCRRS